MTRTLNQKILVFRILVVPTQITTLTEITVNACANQTTLEMHGKAVAENVRKTHNVQLIKFVINTGAKIHV